MSKEEVAVGDRAEFTGFQMAGHTGDHHAWEAILVSCCRGRNFTP